MQLRIICSALLLSFSSYLLANHTPSDLPSVIPQKKATTYHQPASILSVRLYLPLVDTLTPPFIAANGNPAQLTVTPTTTYTVRAIKVTRYSSSNGTCATELTSVTIDNGVGNTVSFIGNHAYTTTDASSYALTQLIGGADGFFNKDEGYQLLDNNLNPIGATDCLAAASVGPTCDSTNYCGWDSARTWTP